MTVVTLRPNGAGNQNTPVTVVNAASTHAALADESDDSYITAVNPINDIVHLVLSNLSPPAGAILKDWRVGVRVAAPTGASAPMQASIILGGGSGVASTSPVVTWTARTTVHSPPTAIGGSTPAQVNDASLVILTSGSTSPAELLRFYEAFANVTYVEKPTLTVTSPSGLTESNVPVVEWAAGLDGDGGAQTHFEVAIVALGDHPDSDPVLDASGVTDSASGSWAPSTPLPGGEYDAYVRIAQTVNGQLHWSDWASSDFAIDAAVPAEPTLVLVPESEMGRMRLDIAEGVGDATADVFEVQAAYDGETWVTIRTPEGFGLVTPSAGEATLYDHDGGNGVDVTYRVRAGHIYTAGTAWSDWSAEQTGMWGPTNDQWLKHPAQPSLNAKVTIYGYGASSRAARRSLAQPLGRSTIVSAADKRAARTGQVQFYCANDAARDAIDALLDAPGGCQLLLQPAATDKRPDLWVVLGDGQREYLVDKAWIDDTIETFEWTEAGRP